MPDEALKIIKEIQKNGGVSTQTRESIQKTDKTTSTASNQSSNSSIEPDKLIFVKTDN